MTRMGERLTRREKEMLGCLATGERPREIAKRLWLSPKTVETHIANASTKLGARTYCQAVYLYAEREREGP